MDPRDRLDDLPDRAAVATVLGVGRRRRAVARIRERRHPASGAALVTIPSPGTGPFHFAQTRSRPLVIAFDGTFEWTGSGWTPFADPSEGQTRNVVEDATGRRYLITLGGSLSELAPDGSTRPILFGVLHVAPAGDGILAIEQPLDSFSTSFFAISPRSPIALSQGGTITAIASDGQAPYAGFATGLFALGRGVWVPAGFGLGVGFTHVPGGRLARHVPLSVLGDDAQWTYLSESCLAYGVRRDETSICVTTDEVRDGDDRIAIVGAPTILWSDGADQVAVAGDAVFAYRDAGGWHTDAVDVAGLRFETVAGAAVTDLYAIAHHPGGRGVFRFDGTTWSLLAALDPVAGQGLAVLADRVLALQGSQTIAIDRTSFATSSVPTPAGFVTLATGTADDAFAVTNIVVPGASALWRFDGATWTPVRLPDNVGPILGLTRSEHGDLLVVAAGGLIGNPAWRLVRTRAW